MSDDENHADDTRPVVFVEPGDAPAQADTALDAAVANGAPIYKSGGQLVTIAEDTTTTADRVKRPRSAPRRLPLTPIALQEIFTRYLAFKKWNARSQDFVPIDCPARIAAALVERGSWPSVPELHGFVGSPTVNAEGEPIVAPGYDRDSGLYVTDWRLGSIALPDDDSDIEALRLQAQAAGVVLQDATATLPFVTEDDWAAALAAIITGVVVRSLEAAPGVVFTAPGAGTGKTMAADLVSIIATGRPSSVMSLGKDANEFDKRLAGTLLVGDQVVCIDNIDRPIGGDLICQAITSANLSIRPLGGSQIVNIPSRSLLLMTGNNVVIRGDLNRRVLVVRLDAKCERPESRHFSSDLLEDAANRRRELVEAALTLVRAYILAGCPSIEGLDAFGSFGTWDRLVRRPLVWAGFGDPLAPAQASREDDPDHAAMRTLLAAWFDRYGDQPVTAAQVADDAVATEARFDGRPGALENEGLHEAIAQILGGQVTARALGYVLRRYRDRIADGLKLEHAGATGRNKAAAWRVTQL